MTDASGGEGEKKSQARLGNPFREIGLPPCAGGSLELPLRPWGSANPTSPHCSQHLLVPHAVPAAQCHSAPKGSAGNSHLLCRAPTRAHPALPARQRALASPARPALRALRALRAPRALLSPSLGGGCRASGCACRPAAMRRLPKRALVCGSQHRALSAF